MTEEQSQSQTQIIEHNPELVELIVDSHKNSFGEQVLRVDSDVVFDILYNHIQETQGSQFKRLILDIDYSLEHPVGKVVDELLANEEVEFWRKDDAEYMAKMRNAEQLNDLFEFMKGPYFVQYAFVKNPQEADVKQIFALGCLMVHINNAGMLPHTNLFVPGGDWMYKPENWDDHLPDGSRAGGMNYTRWRRFEKYGHIPQDLFRDARELTKELWGMDDVSINVYGPHFSGKSAFVGSATTIVKYNTITIYPKFQGEQGTEPFIAELEARVQKKEQPYALDSVDNLSEESLTAAREAIPKLLCVSMEKLPGFDRYINIADYHKVEEKANIPTEE